MFRAEVGPVRLWTESWTVRTDGPLQFVDVTERARAAVCAAGMGDGLAVFQVLHTTAALVVNENEPLLMGDLRGVLERLAPRSAVYAHDDLARRRDVPPDEPKNGHSHCKAVVLSSSVALGVAAGRLLLGRWQRLFLVELDGGRERTLTVTAIGAPAAAADAR
jgi:secondary thiamine-phosphate synthase enzyme